MKTDLQFTLNGAVQHISTDPRRTLLAVLREDLALTGTKYGCGEGQCRACTVLLDGAPITSCLTPISAVQDKSIETIEGVASGDDLHPVQQAFIDEQAMQCGYCIPGMMMSTLALLRKNPSPTNTEIVQALNGNLCRCCGYPNILNAVRRAAQHEKEVSQP